MSGAGLPADIPPGFSCRADSRNVEAEASRFHLPHCALDVLQLGRRELDRVIRRSLEIGNLPGARVIDRRPAQRRYQGIRARSTAQLAKLTHCRSPPWLV